MKTVTFDYILRVKMMYKKSPTADEVNRGARAIGEHFNNYIDDGIVNALTYSTDAGEDALVSNVVQTQVFSAK